MPAVSEAESRVSNGYNSVIGDNYTDDSTLYEALDEQIISDSLKLINLAGDIIPEGEELRKIHELYVKAVNDQHQAFSLLLSATYNSDHAMAASANEKLADARLGVRNYNAELRAYAKTVKVEITDPG
ncbi:hypothetical protein FACS1894120_0410 [Clostridia bacterium]|nr:hypothetical protein FACS1894120_0410 [Clostridia bacterium]